MQQVLTALQILGRGNCFDDICQLSLMSKPMAAATFHKFCKHFAQELFEEHIYLPTGSYQDEVMCMYDKLGMTGAIGSTDVTHIGWGMCPFTLGRSYTGKEGFPTIAYQVTVDHAGRAIAITSGFTGATNDKTIMRYDAGVHTIKTDAQYTKRTYKLRRADGTYRERKGGFTGATNDKTIMRYDAGVHTIKTDAQYTKRTYKLRRADGTFRERKGCYLIVDNGYHEVNSLGHPNRMREDYPLAGNTRAGLLCSSTVGRPSSLCHLSALESVVSGANQT
ncbi:unnamed protein product [Ectocarpus sp. CCAP 1310/34]|nr:unnamed protein product [Ectocarpus sp. CCAP 1310/34]